MLILYGFRATRPWQLKGRPTLIAVDPETGTCWRDLETGAPAGTNEQWDWDNYMLYLWKGPTPRWALDADLRMDEGL